VEVVLGPGGIVAEKRLSPGVWEYRLDHVHQKLAQARSDLASGSWWGEQFRKTSRSIKHRRRYAAPCLAALLLVSAWLLQRRAARRRLSQAR
jgi:hypothetical protein